MLDAQRMEGVARCKLLAPRYRLRSAQVNAAPACNRRFATVSIRLGHGNALDQRVLSRIRRLRPLSREKERHVGIAVAQQQSRRRIQG